MLENLWEGLVGLIRVPEGTGDERRHQIRVECRYPVVVSIRVEGRERSFRARVTDMGLVGMRLRGGERLERDQAVFVTLVDVLEGFSRDTIRCRVIWSRKRRASDEVLSGLLYEDTHENVRNSWVKYVLQQMGFEAEHLYQRRGDMRVVSDLPASLEWDQQKAPARVLNLGVGGALMESDRQLLSGQALGLRIGPYGWLPPLSVKAEVIGPDGRESSRYRLRFVDLGSSRVNLLGQYLLKLLRDEGARSPDD